MAERSSYARRRKLADDARDAFLRAAAACAEGQSTEVLAFALVQGALGVYKIAKADEDEKVFQLVMERLKVVMAEG